MCAIDNNYTQIYITNCRPTTNKNKNKNTKHHSQTHAYIYIYHDSVCTINIYNKLVQHIFNNLYISKPFHTRLHYAVCSFPIQIQGPGGSNKCASAAQAAHDTKISYNPSCFMPVNIKASITRSSPKTCANLSASK